MSMARHHAEKLSLVKVSGPFLSVPVLSEVCPTGLKKPADEAGQARLLWLAYEEWRANQQEARQVDPAMHQAWGALLCWSGRWNCRMSLLVKGQALPLELMTEGGPAGALLAKRNPWRSVCVQGLAT